MCNNLFSLLYLLSLLWWLMSRAALVLYNVLMPAINSFVIDMMLIYGLKNKSQHRMYLLTQTWRLFSIVLFIFPSHTLYISHVLIWVYDFLVICLVSVHTTLWLYIHIHILVTFLTNRGFIPFPISGRSDKEEA